MKRIIIVASVILLASVFFLGCGNRQINEAKAHLITKYADNPGMFTAYFDLKGHLVVDSRQVADNTTKVGGVTADDIRAYNKKKMKERRSKKKK